MFTNHYKRSEQKVSKEYNHEVGYEGLIADFKVYKKQTPRGVTLTKGGNNIYLQFKTPNKPRSKYQCNCTFSINGMIDAVRKAHKVKEQLESLASKVEFWEWYDKEIKNESQLVDDRLTFGEAIKKVEDDFWSRLSRTKRKRDKSNPSDINSYHEVYGKFFAKLPIESLVKLETIILAVNTQEQGTTTYAYAVSAMKKLAKENKIYPIYRALEELNTEITKFRELQSIDLECFIEWRDEILGRTSKLHANCNIDERKAWAWIFSAQILYALGISEAFAIKNLFKDYRTKDGTLIPALNDPNNTSNLIYIGDKTIIGTTVKTGSRIARPQIPPRYPNLMEEFDIKTPLIPTCRPRSRNPKTLVKFLSKEARTRLVRWKAPFTQTHADRNLGNVNGMQAGIPQEIRSMSMGHTVQSNEHNYKNRIGTKTKIDLLLNSNQNAIDFVTALAEAKKLAKDNESDKPVIAKLLSIIYQKRQDEIIELLS